MSTTREIVAHNLTHDQRTTVVVVAIVMGLAGLGALCWLAVLTRQPKSGARVNFRATVNVPSVIISALIGAAVIVLAHLLADDLDREAVVLVIGFLGGQMTCLWLIATCRDREDKS